MRKYSSASAIFSVVVHSVIFLGFIYIETVSFPDTKTDLVEVGFGEGFGSGGGGFGTTLNPGKFSAPEPENKNELVNKRGTEENSAKALRDEDVIGTASKSSGKNKSNNASVRGEASNASGFGTGKGAGIGPGEGDGLGFNIDWGGGGRRKILSYPLPEYPRGANKQLDVKIRFSILADGTVGMRTLLTKGDARLENAALSAIQMWRFEQLPESQKSFTQSAVIIFQFRLR